MVTNEIKIPIMWQLRQASNETGLSYDHRRRLCLQGKIRHVRVGDKQSKILVNAESLVAWMNGGE